MNAELVTLTFLAPIPRGNRVVHAVVRSGPDAARLMVVHDLTTGIVYCPQQLVNPLGSRAALEDPLGVLERLGWTIEQRLEGRVAGAMCSAHGQDTRTRLAIAPEVAYR